MQVERITFYCFIEQGCLNAAQVYVCTPRVRFGRTLTTKTSAFFFLLIRQKLFFVSRADIQGNDRVMTMHGAPDPEPGIDQLIFQKNINNFLLAPQLSDVICYIIRKLAGAHIVRVKPARVFTSNISRRLIRFVRRQHHPYPRVSIKYLLCHFVSDRLASFAGVINVKILNHNNKMSLIRALRALQLAVNVCAMSIGLAGNSFKLVRARRVVYSFCSGFQEISSRFKCETS